MAQHVSNVIKRGYVTLEESSRRLAPAPLGLALVHAYVSIDEGLVLPCVRASIGSSPSHPPQMCAFHRDGAGVTCVRSPFRPPPTALALSCVLVPTTPLSPRLSKPLEASRSLSKPLKASRSLSKPLEASRSL